MRRGRTTRFIAFSSSDLGASDCLLMHRDVKCENIDYCLTTKCSAVFYMTAETIPELASQVYGPISPSFTVHMSLTTSV